MNREDFHFHAPLRSFSHWWWSSCRRASRPPSWLWRQPPRALACSLGGLSESDARSSSSRGESSCWSCGGAHPVHGLKRKQKKSGVSHRTRQENVNKISHDLSTPSSKHLPTYICLLTSCELQKHLPPTYASSPLANFRNIYLYTDASSPIANFRNLHTYASSPLVNFRNTYLHPYASSPLETPTYIHMPPHLLRTSETPISTVTRRLLCNLDRADIRKRKSSSLWTCASLSRQSKQDVTRTESEQVAGSLHSLCHQVLYRATYQPCRGSPAAWRRQGRHTPAAPGWCACGRAAGDASQSSPALGYAHAAAEAPGPAQPEECLICLQIHQSLLATQLRPFRQAE